MKSYKLLILPSLLVLLTLACNNADKPQSTSKSQSNGSSEFAKGAEAVQPAATNQPAAANRSPIQAVPDPLKGTVKETMDSGGYTYVRLAHSDGEVWTAARRFEVKVGDEVEFGGLMPMINFKSPSLDRTFDAIQFVSSARILGADGSPKTAPESVHGSNAPLSPDPGGANARSTAPDASQTSDKIEKLADGMSVAELFEKSAALGGQKVKFRGRVVKANRGILNRNWLHIQDGTGSGKTSDITVTSVEGYAEVGSIVVVEGTLGLNRDFGAGYTYEVIVEDATISSGN